VGYHRDDCWIKRVFACGNRKGMVQLSLGASDV
jgi:hypothetical protein